MKIALAAAALLSVSAIDNTADNQTEFARSVWEKVDPRRTNETVQMCIKSSECPNPDHVCASHNWEYNGQFEGMRGCWHKSVCQNELMSQSFFMFDDRKIQWFCGDDAHEKANGDYDVANSYAGFRPVAENHWPEYQTACKIDKDCWDRSEDENQRCTAIYWEAKNDGSNFGLGNACYSYGGADPCPNGADTPSFAEENVNYDNTNEFSYYNQLWCTGNDKGLAERMNSKLAGKWEHMNENEFMEWVMGAQALAASLVVGVSMTAAL